MPESPDENLTPQEWERLRDLVECFEVAWSKQNEPDLTVHLPSTEDPLRPAILRELVRTDMEIRYRRGRPPDLGAYLQRFPELGSRPSLTKLLFEEYRLRRRFGQPVSMETYRARYPQQYEEFERLVSQAALSSTERPPASQPSQPSPASLPVSQPARTLIPVPTLATQGNPGVPTVVVDESEAIFKATGYRLLKKIGRGTFGEVYEAEAPGGFRCAVKVLERTIDSEEVQRERRSLEVIRHMDHSSLLQVSAAWSFEDRLIIAMQLATKNLRERLRECQKEGLKGIPRQELLKYMYDSAEGLDYLHGKNALHRDIKPDNILLRGGAAKLADFGLLRDQNTAATMNRPVGTPPYMGPEVWSCRAVAASDQYALACTYVELRCGRRPFVQKSTDELSVAHSADPPDLSLLSAPEQRVLNRALAKQPGQRYPNCLEFVLDLGSAVGGGPSSDQIPIIRPPTPLYNEPTDVEGSLMPARRGAGSVPLTHSNHLDKTGPLEPAAPEVDPWRRQPEPKWPVTQILIGLCVVGVLGAVAWYFIPRHPPSPKHDTPVAAVKILEGGTVFLHPGESREISLPIERQGSEDFALEFTDVPDGFEISPEKINPGDKSVKVTIKSTPMVLTESHEVAVAVKGAQSGEPVKLYIHVLPPGYDQAEGEKGDWSETGHSYFSRIVRKIDGEEVFFLLVRPGVGKPFYLMENKVWNGLFAAFAKAKPEAVAKSSWHLGGKAAGKDLLNKDNRLPVFRVTKVEAEAFAEWLNGKLPKAAQLDQAPRTGPQVVGRWKQGPKEAPAQNGSIHDLDGNGREWTFDTLKAGDETLAVLRGRSYAAPVGRAKPDFKDPRLIPTQHPEYASPFTSFRVAIDLPAR